VPLVCTQRGRPTVALLRRNAQPDVATDSDRLRRQTLPPPKRGHTSQLVACPGTRGKVSATIMTGARLRASHSSKRYRARASPDAGLIGGADSRLRYLRMPLAARRRDQPFWEGRLAGRPPSVADCSPSLLSFTDHRVHRAGERQVLLCPAVGHRDLLDQPSREEQPVDCLAVIRLQLSCACDSDNDLREVADARSI